MIKIKKRKPHNFEVDDMVIYNINTLGRVKKLNDDTHVFVVYNCNNSWNDYKDYTAANTHVSNLRHATLKDLVDNGILTGKDLTPP